MPASSQSPPPTRRRSSASPSPAAGVKGVTRKVIRTLEGLGHAMEADADDEAEDEEVAAALKADRRAGKQRALEDGAEAKKIDWEIPRKVFHSSIGFITLGLYLTPSMSPRTVTLVLWSALAVIAPTDVVRLRVPAVERVYERCLGFLMRESERTGTNGTLWYMLGVNFALTFYPIDVATVAILMAEMLLPASSTVWLWFTRRCVLQGSAALRSAWAFFQCRVSPFSPFAPFSLFPLLKHAGVLCTFPCSLFSPLVTLDGRDRCWLLLSSLAHPCLRMWFFGWEHLPSLAAHPSSSFSIRSMGGGSLIFSSRFVVAPSSQAGRSRELSALIHVVWRARIHLRVVRTSRLIVLSLTRMHLEARLLPIFFWSLYERGVLKAFVFSAPKCAYLPPVPAIPGLWCAGRNVLVVRASGRAALLLSCLVSGVPPSTPFFFTSSPLHHFPYGDARRTCSMPLLHWAGVAGQQLPLLATSSSPLVRPRMSLLFFTFLISLSWADTAASTLGRMYGPRTPPLPASLSLAWLPAWVWVPGFLLAPSSPSSSSHSSKANGIANGSVKANGNGVFKENPKSVRRLKTPFAARKSTAGFLAACTAGALVALAFWWGVAGEGRWGKGVAEMRKVAEGVPGATKGYHSQYSIAGQYLRSEEGAWARRWVPEGLIGGVEVATTHAPGTTHTTPARFGVGGVWGLVALVLFAGVVSGVAEALDLGGLDDNLTLPIISGGALMLFFRVWGWAVGA
ncbi:hypothetical protein DFH06DRAFT_1322742 [Mycena polygramma]|nr:hypothetical protein DFH06DRAFT_1322742 [Mycena polygramma]